jgi:multisubunit Na+/H+ antiporter MnhF subunit
LELACVLGTIVLMLLCQGANQPSCLIVSLVLTVLSFADTLVFTRLLGGYGD